MNIFVTDKCPKKSAKYLFENTSFKRANKMILESAQLLATSIHLHGGKATYKPTHKNHPVAIWARETRSNYMWLFDHFLALNNEFTKLRNKQHKCLDHTKEFFDGRIVIPEGDLTEFANCARNKSQGLDFTHISDVCEAYREYLKLKG